MASRMSDILLHPIRLRIVLAAIGDEVTTADIAERLPDVPQATLYRQVAALVEAGILDVIAERRARGAVEKTFAVNIGRASLKPEDVEGMSADDHLEAFAVFAGALIESYGRYLDTPGAQPARDGVSYRQARLWLTDDELEDLRTEMANTLAPSLELQRAPGRSARLLSTILMPDPTSPRDD